MDRPTRDGWEGTSTGPANMHMRFAFLLLGLLACEKPAPAPAAGSRLAPVPAKEAVSTHGPYGAGVCAPCHRNDDAQNPGPAVTATSELCIECHEEFKGGAVVKTDKSVHPKGPDACTVCHNPHNARKKKLRL
jgi:predicted CXXCH cytochrome family protein